MLRLLAVFLLLSVPAYAAGGSGGDDDKPKCPAGKVLDKKTNKCVDAQRSAISYGETYPKGLIPTGFYGFCADHPKECEPTEPDILTSDWLPVLDRINREVNAAITYRAEDDKNADKWTVSPDFGDCDDYTVTKRQKLIEAGVPRGTMRAAYVLTHDQISHVFLVVSTVQGDFVLDNRSDEVFEIERAMIDRLSIQDQSDPKAWWQIY